MKKISVMIPCYNEEENVRAIYEAVRDELCRSCKQYDFEILFIDNKSQDNTRQILRDICREDRRVKAIFNCKNFGQFNSPFYGMLQTTGDCTITICADFQDPVELIPTFVHEWEKGYKIVIGRKTKSQENSLVYFLRSCYYKLIRKMSSVDMIEHLRALACMTGALFKPCGSSTIRPPLSGGSWRSWALNARKSNTPSPSAGREKPTTTGTVCLTRQC